MIPTPLGSKNACTHSPGHHSLAVAWSGFPLISLPQPADTLPPRGGPPPPPPFTPFSSFSSTDLSGSVGWAVGEGQRGLDGARARVQGVWMVNKRLQLIGIERYSLLSLQRNVCVGRIRKSWGDSWISISVCRKNPGILGSFRRARSVCRKDPRVQ